MKRTYGMAGKFKAKEGHGEELVAILLKASQLISSARGLYVYIVATDLENADVIWVTEAWETKEDHDNSLNLPGVKELIASAMPFMDGKPDGTVLNIRGGKGIV